MAHGFVLPELYAKNCRVAHTYTTHLLKKYKNHIKFPKNASILEYGFGDGSNCQKSLQPLLPQDYKEFVATDISRKMINFAKQNVTIPKIQFEQLEIHSTHIPSDFKSRFDIVISFFTNHLVSDPKQMFKNIASLLKPGGQTFQITFKRSPLDIIFHNLSTDPKWGKYDHKKIISPYYFDTDPRKITKDDLALAGFKDNFVEEDNFVYEFENEQEWQGLYTSANPVLADIPMEDIPEYTETYLNEIRKHVLINDQDGDVPNPKAKYDLYTISAFKSK